MAGPSWLVDSNRIATKIKSASGARETGSANWKSNPTRACPNCQHVIDNSDVAQEWPGLPRGVKFDPSDQEIIWHLLAKVGVVNLKPHPFIDEFIPTVDEEDGICYKHPQKLPGVKQDGSASHFFYRAIKAYNTGTRKRRKIHDDDLGDVRWHKTGRTKPVILDGVQKGCKKIMVLYVSPVRGGKSEKTNWVMHQYHLGTEEDEKEGEYVISKVFYQQQQVKQSDKIEQDLPDDIIVAKVDPVTPMSVTPVPPRTERRTGFDPGQDSMNHGIVDIKDEAKTAREEPILQDQLTTENNADQIVDNDEAKTAREEPILQDQPSTENNADQIVDNDENQGEEDPKWWDGESQYLLDSQQLVEGLSLCDELLRSQSPDREENRYGGESNGKPRLSDYAHLGPENLKKDLMECQELVLDPANIELDTPPDFRLSQLEFGSQESFLAWGGGNV
ncbi:SUPPRESSOR OF GAMMA RESPONSE 1 isoform X2 [Cornus florida]|uniref:SUPPRESSOR OF GAMMA RESPONSE 1 isoform X2 n=1 Tax=Cornus florida TaxID=4283 RepID=UPI002896307D|nr:SUPPRESSOR OF GAMMA RESPONSE 1 isoform X2 [Cornus florida]